MNPARFIRSRATALWRALSVLVVVAGAVTCDSPTSLGHRVSLAVAPVFGKLSMSGFSGLTVDSVRLTVVRPPSDTVSQQTFAFSPDSATITANLTVNLAASHEQLVVLIAFLSNSQVVFSGVDTVDVVAGGTTSPTASVPISYVGPGQSVAAIHITPRDSGATFGATVPFVITATDSSNANVAQFYVHWSTSRAGDTINAAGMFRPAAVRGLAWVRARTPSGIWDSARIAVVPVANSIVKVSGDAQTGPVSTALAQPLVVRVFAADNLPVVGAPVQFAAASGGGSVGTQLVATDTSGRASTTATLGASLGIATFSATIQGTSFSVTFADTALNAHGVPTTITKVAGDSQIVAAGSSVAVLPKVQVRDAFGAVVAGASVTFSVQSGGGSVSGGTVSTDVNGFAAVGSWTLGSAAGSNTLRASIPSAPAVNPVTFTATGKPFVTLSVVGSNVAGVGRAGLIAVKLSQPDAVADTVAVTSDSTSFLVVTLPVVIFAPGDTLKVVTDTGLAAGTAVVRATPVTGAILPRYFGTSLTVPVTTNVISLPANVTVASGGTAPVTVTLSSPAPNGGVVVGLTSTDPTKATFTTPTVTVPASSTSVNATVQGLATGSAVLVASSPAYAPASTPVTVTAGSGVASTSVTPHFDTLTSLTDTFALAAQAKNNLGGNVAGTFTWVSRDTTKVKVGAAGAVKAIANGSTYVVATETGGTKDSAYVTVQQRLATINVTPGTRNIYLTRNFTFSAAAVDGRGFAMPGVTTFNWTTTAPAVASIDTSVHAASTIVTAAGLGAAQVKATSGTVIGVANVSVLTPITRIAVVVDSTGANTTKPDTATLVSLGITRRYRAYAFDTVNVLIPGDTTFNWVSTNGAVASIDSTVNAVHTTATSLANGNTTINATAQGFTSTPGASLTVAQLLASIELKPDTNNPTATVAVAGTMHVTARGKDANNRYISGGTFRYHSSTLVFATVDSVTGMVTGVSIGPDTVTATSGAITSNKVIVTISNGGPAIISFGRDTLSVGRGNNQAFPILLSRPDTAALIVKLTAPAFAHWQTPTVTIPLGQTSVNATLVGDSAGTTTVTATDSSGHGFAGASAVAKVTANMRLTSGGYAINATDIVTTQVLLSDPSPAGGTYVTFNYSTLGVASVSPDPAFIPFGQLAADIQIRGIGAGTTTITPNAIGVNGAASSFTAYAAVLTPYPALILVGQGQYDPNDDVQIPTYTNVPVPVTITSTDANTIITSPTAVTIPGGSYYAYFNTIGKAIGSATLNFAATGWTPARTVTVISTPPKLGITGGYQLNTTSPQQTMTVYTEDSASGIHYRVNSLAVRVHSTDTTRIKVLDTLVTVAPGTDYASSRIIPGGLGGTAYVIATASGHTPDSTLWTVVGPKLQFSWFADYIGLGQYDPNTYVQTPDYVTAPLIVSVSNSNPTAVTVPSADTIPTSSYYRSFNTVAGALGTSTLIASAPGYQPDTASVTITSPRLISSCCGGTLNNFGPGTSAYAVVADSFGTTHYRITPLTVSVTSTDTTVIRVDSTTLTILAGVSYTTTTHVTPVGLGTARVIFTAPGHRPDSLSYSVVMPQVRLTNVSHTATFPTLLGRRQHFDPNNNGIYISTPDYRTTPLQVTIVQLHGTVDSLTTTTPTIGAGTYYQYLDAYGLNFGQDTLIVSAVGYLPDTAYIRVTTPALVNSGFPGSATTTNPPFGLNVYATDSVGNIHYPMDTVVVNAVSSDITVIRPGQTTFRIPKNVYYASTTVSVVGPGSAHMTYSDSTPALGGYVPYTPTTTTNVAVTGPSFGISNGTTMLGMRQTNGQYSANIYIQFALASPLAVHLRSTDTTVVTVPDTVIIPAGSTYAYFPITAMSATGTIQVQAIPPAPYTTVSTTVQVTQPKFVISASTQLNTTSPRAAAYVYAEDANGGYHYPTERVTVTLASSAASVASFDSLTVTIDTTNYYSNIATWGPGIVGTAQLTATDTRAVSYKYNTGSLNVAVIEPSLSFGSYPGALGIGQYQDYVYAQVPNYATSPISVAFTHGAVALTGTSANGTNTPITGVTIGTGTYYAYFRMSGLARSTVPDTMVASATSPAHFPATIVTVVDSGRVDPLSGWPGTIKAGDSVLVTLYARDPNTNSRYVVANTQFTLAPNASIEFRSGGSVITSATIPADAQYVQFYLKGLTQGTGSVTITNSSYKTYTNTVTVTP